MGSSCSSGQAHKDKDSVSTRSEDSPSYQAAAKRNHSGAGLDPYAASTPASAAASAQPPGSAATHSGVILEPANIDTAKLAGGDQWTTGISTERKLSKDGLAKVRGVATSSISADSMSLSSPPAQSPRDSERGPPSSAAPCSATPSSAALQLPPEVRRLPEGARHLLLGHVAAARVAPRCRKIALYVCAADSQDCCVEKGALHNKVYPAVRARCRQRGYELHVVDLHWRTALEKQQDHEFPELCLGELAREMQTAYVVPVLFLSNSLGTPLLPNTVETQDFEMALERADNKELLRKWYRLDSAAQPPCYRLQPTALHIPGFKENCPDEKERALSEWRSEIERTLAVMVNVFPQELRDTYLTTVVEQEVHNTVCMSQELARRCLWLYRLYTHTGPTTEPSTPGDVELLRRLDTLHKELKTQLSEKHILRIPVRWVEGGLNTQLPEHAQYVSEVVTQLTTHLNSVIDSIIEEDQSKMVLKSSYGISGQLLQELMLQTGVCQQAAQSSVNREAVLNDIRSYLTGDCRQPLILSGCHGCGKSTLMARAAQCCHTWLPEAVLAIRFVGVSSRSRTVEQLLSGIADQISVVSVGHQCWATQNVKSLSEKLPALLAAACLQRPQIIMIDGIDQIREYGSKTIDWLPLTLPESVKLIVSVADDSPLFTELKERFGAKAQYIKMPDLGKEEAEAILMASVMQYNHSVNSRVHDCVRSSVQSCTLPLYVKVLAWQTSWWSHTDHNVAPTGDVIKQINQMLEEIENILGQDMVEHALSLITAAKTGVTDSEILDILAHDSIFHSTATYVPWAPACLFWARLNKYMGPFLRWSATADCSTAQWNDEMLLQTAAKRYSHRRKWAHETLVQYYQGIWSEKENPQLVAHLLTQPNNSDGCYNDRKLEELPYQLYKVKGSIKEEFLLNDKWLYDKLCGSDIHQVLEDFALEESNPETWDVELELLQQCLQECGSALLYDGRQMYSQLLWRLQNQITSKGEIGMPHLSNLLQICRDPPVPSLLPVSNEGLLSEEEEQCSDTCIDLIARLGNCADFVATVATEHEEIAVWSVRTNKKVRTLQGVTRPGGLRAIDWRRAVVLCRRELRVYDLDAGRLIVRLKGVMNQKMPFFGLHDDSHLVALSRNRMYVNLMDLRTGDCVTTFKAGEDRFLNSLLVSGDGRVLVCGDETQKPFPLLVWNLASRKLLYDLRIPHHDFITSLAAITHEGHYVCCVAKEVDEPSPNFIVVYDLQSGTLFKKWKPGVDTVSLDISSRDGCVISGLEDARILVWDLVTGNCRWNLCGHTAPVTFLRLDPLGGSFLSADSSCRDRSLRLWSLSKGELLAVYTPEKPVTSCEVTSGGCTVVLALRGCSHILTLQLHGPGIQSPTDGVVTCYGDPGLEGKVFNVEDEER
ncbi:NACHT domain- and WD repeat-containing protein 1 [Schistocerca gregaria]|uniref:NACHT domain- and WD repeat-containing protein 1 n=1 Tax=Schistocerca gregaria TaxID=7010 RepID=UPI00211DDB7A|nr:NACHT domain- and WD repeat-containing protein 1 [Schistocerca gregaria]